MPMSDDEKKRIAREFAAGAKVGLKTSLRHSTIPKLTGLAGGAIGITGADAYNKMRLKRLRKRGASDEELAKEKEAAARRKYKAMAFGKAIGAGAGHGLMIGKDIDDYQRAVRKLRSW